MSFRSHNFPDRYLRHANYVLRIDPILTAVDRADATFQIGY
ncbi:AbfB domain-containing protein [Saccharothrix sp. CB00851]